MEIRRDRLAAEFAAFERQGDGVVIGAPGVGKTHLLAQHFRSAHAGNRPASLLALDKHSVRNDVELRAELGLEADFVETLAADARATVASPGLLLVDSYDALRSEEAQEYVRTLIRRAQNVLQNRWRVIVAVRTFDALRSETLLELFPRSAAAPPAEFQMRGVHCRHFVVPTLSDVETHEAVATIPGLELIYERGSPDFRWLLHTPFNLWLAEKLLSGGVDPGALSEVSSEVQLLSLFWRQRVSTGLLSLRRRSILTDIARTMVEARQLSLRQDALYRRDDDEIWRDLFSSEVLTELGTSGQRVAFAHNILFDFAVSVLLIEDEPAQVAAFLAAEPARPVFLRPSINYYFTRLWFDNRDVFWRVAWFLLTSGQVHLRLFGRLVPMAVVVREARTVDDLAPVFQSLERNEHAAPEAVLRLLQARRALKAGREDMWLAAFERLIGRPDRRFAWDLTVQTFDAIDGDASAAVSASAGRIGRSVLAYVWALRRDQAWADALGASWATRLVARTHCSDPEESRVLLRAILESIDDRTLSVEYVRHITWNIEAIWPCDPAFVADIYVRVFAHRETSTDATSMGSPVLPMTSNRRQDFGMCIYELNKHYDDFLAANEEHALRGGIAAVDQFVERDHVAPYINEGHTIDELTARFRFNEREAMYVADISESWRATSYQDEELKIADAIFAHIERAATNRDERSIDACLGLFVETARMAFWWGELLNIGARHGELFAQRLYPLCVAEPVLAGSATVKQVTDFVAAAYPFWSPEQRRDVERAVMALSREDGDEEWAVRRRQRILGLIPADLVVTPEARAVRAEMALAGRQPTNEPLVRFSFSSGTFGETEWLREQGADLEKPSNQRLREVSAPLEGFEKTWQNGIPTAAAITDILPTIEESRRLLIDTDADAPVVAMVQTRIASAAMVAARTAKPGDASFDLVRSTLLDAAQHRLAEDDEPRNEERDYPSWSSRPETEAAQGLPWVALRQPDQETLGTIEALVRNPDAIIRYLVVRELFRISDVAPDVFWRLIDDRIANDNASVVRLAICESLARVAGRQQERVADAARRLWMLLSHDRSKRSEFRNILLDIVIWLRLERGHAWAREALNELAHSPMSNPSLLHAAVFQMWHKAIPSRLATHPAVVEDVLAFVSDAVRHSCRVLRERDRAHDERDADRLKDLYGVIDESVAHVYFCLSREHSRDGNATPEARREFFSLVAPILDEILDFGLDRGFVLAPTVHHFMQLLNEVVRFDAHRAVIMAARAARAGEGTNYNIDSLAIREVVQIVERVLADHRSEVQDPEALQALMDLLDVFAATGWPEAIRLVWRLDELFR
jgi:hypothetical protein